MMHSVVCDDAFRFIVILPARIQITIKARKVAARHFQTNAMTGFKEIAGRHWLQRDFVDFARFHPRQRFVVAVAIAHALDRFVQIVRASVRVHVNQLDGEIRVFCIGRNIERDFNRAAHFDAFGQRFGAVDEDVRALFHLALIERSALHCVARAAHIAAVRRHRIHRVVIEFVRRVGQQQFKPAKAALPGLRRPDV